MSYRQNPNIGDDIKNIMNDALSNNNFSKLNQDIGRTVNDALNDFESVFMGKPRQRDPDILWKPLSKDNPKTKSDEDYAESYKGNHKNKYKDNYNGNYKKNYKEGYKGNFSTKNHKNPSKMARNSKSIPGSVSGTLMTIFGYLGVVFSGIGLFGAAIVEAVIGTGFMISLGITIPILAISSVVAWKGTCIRRKVKRIRRYNFILDGRKYCDIKELSEPIGKTVKWVAKDLQKMIYSGIFPYGHLDEKKTCLMLDNDTYQQYLKTKRWSIEQQELQKEENINEKKKSDSKKFESEAEREQHQTIEEGKNFILLIRKANDDIPGKEVSKKLDRLENIIESIFKHVEAHPHQIPEIRKFMNYYLPTTLKLTTAYAKLDDHVLEGENISSAKDEIRKTLDTINMAFENLLDDLFYHSAMEISSEISVLETMFAQEGLTENDFKVKRKKREEKGDE